MNKIVLATNNNKKVKELKKMLEGYNFDVVSLKEENINIDVEEDGLTFEENAEKKATEIYDYLRENGKEEYLVLADDSGLETDYLNGAPGVYSARFAGTHGNDEANNEKLLLELRNAEGEERKARFVCALALIGKDIKKIIRGTVEGYIEKEFVQNDAFGYDPLFYCPLLGKTFSEATAEEKNSVSHRGNALNELAVFLKTL